MSEVRGGSRLETIISWVLILGVLSSLVFEVTGLVLNYLKTGDLSLTLTPSWNVQSANFISFAGSIIPNIGTGPSAFSILALGIILLMFTPYVRVVVSVLYYGMTRDYRYLGITLLVLAIITASLLAL